INGTISNPDPDFNINLPTVSSTLKSEIQTVLDDKDTRQTQALYLLATDSFLSEEGANVGQNALYNNMFQTMSGVFDDLFFDADSKISIGVGYVAPEKNPNGDTNGNVSVSTSFNINERISVNGVIGVPVGDVNQAAVIGDLEVLYRVNDDGSLNFKVFNRENDINYIGEGVGYTQGIGITYQVDFDTFDELYNKVFRSAKYKLEQENKPKDEVPDSNYTPEFINFTEPKKNLPEKPKSEKEKIEPPLENVPEE
ncbi:MAG TPA: translocation/assembly module TamB domain-containing protein, partial [Flavobacterium sp.]|nr:translocation/assembly module TamB domain-containing protein [Flavobacterium sp.]HRZ75702.1 translocation/assembly module TamB domain-containing protein [Flavobacterium sp.]